MIRIGDKVVVINSGRYNYQQIGTVTNIRIYGSGFLTPALYCVDFDDASFGVYSEDELEIVTKN